MATYVINFSDTGKTPISVAPRVLNGPGQLTQSTDITLIGQDRFLYGEFHNETVLHLLENFAHGEVSPGVPDSSVLTAPIEGQMWYNSTQEKLFVYNGSAWASVTAGLLPVDGSASMAANLNMGNFRIVNMLDPSSAQDAATKAYVDSAIAGTNSLDELTDVTLTAPVSGHTLVYNGSLWVNTLLDLTGLSDVTITGVASGDTLTYNGSVWVNQTSAQFTESVQDSMNTALAHGSHSGVAVSYNDGSNRFEINVNDPLITIDGAVTGSATMTDLGNVTITTTSNHNHDSTYVNASGDTMTGDLTMQAGTDIIINDAPTVGTHATNKTYVDAQRPAALRGFVLDQGTVPVPSGYTRAQCVWAINIYDAGNYNVANGLDWLKYTIDATTGVATAQYSFGGAATVYADTAEYIIIGISGGVTESHQVPPPPPSPSPSPSPSPPPGGPPGGPPGFPPTSPE